MPKFEVQTLKQVKADLKSPHIKQRLQAIEALEDLESQAALKHLLEALADSAWQVRKEAAKVLATYRFPEVTKALVHLLKDNHAGVRNAALQALCQIGNQVGDFIIDEFSNLNQRGQILSIQVLGEVKAKQAVPFLIQIINQPADPNIKTVAVEALGEIGDRSAVKPLLSVLKEDLWLAYPAIMALGKLKDAVATLSLTKLLTDEALRMPTIEALGSIADARGIQSLGQVLSEGSEEEQVEAVKALAKIIEAGTDPQLPGIERSMVRDEFREVFEEKKLGTVLAKLLAREEEVQGAALRLVAEVGKPTSALPYLAILLRKGFERRLALEALQKMARFSPTEVFTSLKNWLGRREVALKSAAAFILGELVPDDSVPLLIPLLEDPSPEVRREAALALGKSHYSDVPSLLVSLAQDEEIVREAALEGLTIFFKDDWGEDIFELAKTASSSIRTLVIEALARRPDKNVLSLLTSLLKDADPAIRAKAALLLGEVKLESKTIVEALMELLGDNVPEVQRAAILALGELGVVEASPRLVNFLHQPDPALRVAALSALSKVKDKKATEAVIDCLKKGGKEEKLAALRVLRSIGEEDLASDLLVFLEEKDDEVFNEALRTLAAILKERAISLFNQLLEKERGERRGIIIRALAETRSVKVLPVLLSLLESGQPDEQKAAIEALIGLEESTVIPILLPFLASEHRPQIFQLVISMGELALPGLMLGLSHDDAVVRAGCSYAIGKINASSSASILLKVLEDSDFRVRQAAAAVLGVLKAESAYNYLLLRSVHDEDRLVRKMAQRALARLAS